MVAVELKSVHIDFPIYMLEAQRLRSNLINRLSMGRFGEYNSNRIIVNALRGVDLKLKAGDRLGIIGHNGAGKTTLLQTIAGVLEPSIGERIVKGRISALYNIGLGFDPEASGYENIHLRGLFMGLKPNEIEEIIPDVEEFTELKEFLYLPLRTYSAGMQVRLAFAIATSVDPEILIMDEWLGAGDAEFQAKSKVRMKKIVERSSLLLLASHAEALIKNNCDQAILLNKGRILEHGKVDDVYKAYKKLLN
ncbi:MAG: ABC transporter ATP-binding protein [Pseudomonadota bacterium]